MVAASQANAASAGSSTGGAAQTIATLEALTYDDILKSRVAFGSASGLIDRFNEWGDVLGIDGVIGVDLDSQRNFTGSFEDSKDLGSALDLVTNGTAIKADLSGVQFSGA